MFPMSRKGGASEKFIERKPMAVVTLVKKTGARFRRSDSTTASLRSIPSRIAWKKEMSIWTESATANVSMMVGAAHRGGR